MPRPTTTTACPTCGTRRSAPATAANGKLLLNGGELKIIGNAVGTSERINQFDIFAGTDHAAAAVGPG